MIRKAQKKDIKAMTDLHALILPDSIFVKLGRFFLERYYYDMLTKKEHVFSYVCEHDGRIAGFIAMAASRELFYKQVREDIVPLAMVLLGSVFISPASALYMIKAVAFIARKNKLIQCDTEAELLQIAVHPGYRVRQAENEYTPFFKATGLRIAEELFRKAVTDLRDRNVRGFRIMTGDSNISSNKFYAKMGCRKEASGIRVFGIPTSFYTGKVEDMSGLFHNTVI